MTIWRMRIAFWIPKATHTHSEFEIIIAFPMQKLLQELNSMLRSFYLKLLVHTKSIKNTPEVGGVGVIFSSVFR